MSKVTFRELFDAEVLARSEARKKEREQQAVRGDLFIRQPLAIDVEAIESSVICFISLTCSSCIDLLSELTAFTNHYEGTFILISSGTEEENKAFTEHFQFQFPILTMTKEVRLAKYGTTATPYAYFLEDGYVVNAAIVHDSQDLNNLTGLILTDHDQNMA